MSTLENTDVEDHVFILFLALSKKSFLASPTVKVLQLDGAF